MDSADHGFPQRRRLVFLDQDHRQELPGGIAVDFVKHGRPIAGRVTNTLSPGEHCTAAGIVDDWQLSCRFFFSLV